MRGSPESDRNGPGMAFALVPMRPQSAQLLIFVKE